VVVASAPIFHAEPGARSRRLRLQVMGAGFRAMEESRWAGGQAVEVLRGVSQGGDE
jgi:hypothetical protein